MLVELLASGLDEMINLLCIFASSQDRVSSRRPPDQDQRRRLSVAARVVVVTLLLESCRHLGLYEQVFIGVGLATRLLQLDQTTLGY